MRIADDSAQQLVVPPWVLQPLTGNTPIELDVYTRHQREIFAGDWAVTFSTNFIGDNSSQRLAIH